MVVYISFNDLPPSFVAYRYDIVVTFRRTVQFLFASRFFILFSLDDRNIWIREAKKHVDSVDTDPDP
jgi:hypothetical protein